MTVSSLRVAFAGGEAAGQRVLRSLKSNGHDVRAVFAGGGPSGAPVRAEAQRHGLSVLPAKRVKDPSVTREIGTIDLFVNVHSLYVVDAEMLSWPTQGAFNLHPGWLPDYAGRNCPSWAVWLDEPQPGVTVHRMTPDIDRGEIAFRERFTVGEAATGGSVAVECAKRGVGLMERLVAGIAAGNLSLQPQDATKFRYFGREVPDGGVLRFDRPAATVDRLVRACDYGLFSSPWGTPTTVASVGVRRTKLTGRACADAPGTVRIDGDLALVACADEWLEITSTTIDDTPVSPTKALLEITSLA